MKRMEHEALHLANEAMRRGAIDGGEAAGWLVAGALLAVSAEVKTQREALDLIVTLLEPALAEQGRRIIPIEPLA